MAMMSYREAFFSLVDKDSLRMCEFLLERLPRRDTKPAGNPMWIFLKGIQGFDTSRAAECLGLLLDAQYVSIQDLKEATAQDLIVDARLRPQDALEIVDAAKDEVSSVDRSESAQTGFALPWANESYQPFVSPRSFVKTI